MSERDSTDIEFPADSDRNGIHRRIKNVNLSIRDRFPDGRQLRPGVGSARQLKRSHDVTFRRSVVVIEAAPWHVKKQVR
jgi:hypothetical protein